MSSAMTGITKDDLWKLIQLKCKNMDWLVEPSLRSYHNCIDNLPNYLENIILLGCFVRRILSTYSDNIY